MALKKGVNVKPTVFIWWKLAIKCMENTIVTHPGDIVRPMWACRRPKIVGCQLEKVPKHCRKLIPSAKKTSIIIIISYAQTI